MSVTNSRDENVPRLLTLKTLPFKSLDSNSTNAYLTLVPGDVLGTGEKAVKKSLLKELSGRKPTINKSIIRCIVFQMRSAIEDIKAK